MTCIITRERWSGTFGLFDAKSESRVRIWKLLSEKKCGTVSESKERNKKEQINESTKERKKNMNNYFPYGYDFFV